MIAQLVCMVIEPSDAPTAEFRVKNPDADIGPDESGEGDEKNGADPLPVGLEIEWSSDEKF